VVVHSVYSLVAILFIMLSGCNSLPFLLSFSLLLCLLRSLLSCSPALISLFFLFYHIYFCIVTEKEFLILFVIVIFVFCFFLFVYFCSGYLPIFFFLFSLFYCLSSFGRKGGLTSSTTTNMLFSGKHTLAVLTSVNR